MFPLWRGLFLHQSNHTPALIVKEGGKGALAQPDTAEAVILEVGFSCAKKVTSSDQGACWLATCNAARGIRLRRALVPALLRSVECAALSAPLRECKEYKAI